MESNQYMPWVKAGLSVGATALGQPWAVPLISMIPNDFGGDEPQQEQKFYSQSVNANNMNMYKYGGKARARKMMAGGKVKDPRYLNYLRMMANGGYPENPPPDRILSNQMSPDIYMDEMSSGYIPPQIPSVGAMERVPVNPIQSGYQQVLSTASRIPRKFGNRLMNMIPQRQVAEETVMTSQPYGVSKTQSPIAMNKMVKDQPIPFTGNVQTDMVSPQQQAEEQAYINSIDPNSLYQEFEAYPAEGITDMETKQKANVSSNTPQEEIMRPNGDPYEYKKVGDKYYTRKRGAKNWLTATGTAKDSIMKNIYGESMNTSKKMIAEKNTKSGANVYANNQNNQIAQSNYTYEPFSWLNKYSDLNIPNPDPNTRMTRREMEQYKYGGMQKKKFYPEVV